MTIYDELKERGLIAQVTDENEIKELINNGKAIFYIGFDPTADSLHVGHFMALCLMKRLQLVGNKPIALIGGGTGMIGDPSGKQDLRKMLTVEIIDKNCESIKKQMSRFIDFSDDKALFINNADWLRNLNYVEFLRDIGPHFTVNRMLTAECYKTRFSSDNGLTFLEFNYMIMQAYDFYQLYKKYNCNMQFGGDDQWSNMLAGTELVRRKLSKNVYAMTINLLLNSDGIKMGKTVNGAVWLDENKTSPYDFYQYWRNVDDKDVIKCLKLLTFLPLDEIKEYEKLNGSELNPIKEKLAFELTKYVHGEDKARASEEASKSLFSGNGISENIPQVIFNNNDFVDDKVNILDLLVKSKLCSSKSDARRNVMQGGITVNNQKINEIDRYFTKDEIKSNDFVVKKGKKSFIKIILSILLICSFF